MATRKRKPSGARKPSGRDRAILSWIYSIAGAPGSDVRRALGWCKLGGAGLQPHGNPVRGSWEWPAVQALGPALASTYAGRHAFLLDARFEQPLSGVRNSDGDFAYWLARAFNANTPPVLAVVYLRSRGDGPAAPQYLPAFGGPHFRQSASGSTCVRVEQTLAFASVKQGAGTLALPPGPLTETTYGAN